MKIHFFVRFHTKFGENLFMSGNSIGLGSLNTHSVVPMRFMNSEYWKLEVEIDPSTVEGDVLIYKYLLKNKEGELISEYGYDRTIHLRAIKENKVLKVYDVWNFSGTYDNVFFTSPFKKILLPATNGITGILDTAATHLFKIKAPLLKKGEIVCLLGDNEHLHNWNTQSPILLEKQEDWWVIALNLPEVKFPIVYKYGIFNTDTNEFVTYEGGDNRLCFEPAVVDQQTILHDGFINRPNTSWKGAGVSVPVFSLRTENGLGVGEFSDLKLLTDWVKKTGMKLIQLLPVNDTTATFTWKDSYPYAAISAFALHPIYINIEKVAGKNYGDISKSLQEKQQALNALPEIDYEAVTQLKLSLLHEIYEADTLDCLKDNACKHFVETNEAWLKPYAAFCYLRDKYQTIDASQWKTNSAYDSTVIEKFFKQRSAAYKKVGFYCWVQYHLHLQLKEAVQYAHENGIIIKGDIPIGVYRYGCDAWMAPELYKMNLQAGAPPDDFAVLGQNWGFPTYNWERMQLDGFAWWQQRFEQMGHYFDAFRIDHILGFFRIWSIPLNSVQGIMGKFDPSIPVKKAEFGENGIRFDKERFCNPYITDAVLYELLGENSDFFKKQFLQKSGPDTYALDTAFDTQQKVANWFQNKEATAENNYLKNVLFDLISNVLLFEQEGSEGNEFHFRISIDKTISFKYLSHVVQERMMVLYYNYFYRRQDEFWRKESMKKLPALKEATNMLVCGEDLGMVPACVPDVMRELGILSLEIQRMPKQSEKEFVNLAEVPYLSVVTPSTHDMSTIRGWWQEDRNISQRFYNTVLSQQGLAPYFCEPWINRAIVLQHLYAPAIWSIFQIQDILGMSAELRREMPEEERINIPADSQHYWRYRMHITLEQLINEKIFNDELKEYVKNSGRG
ncbi:MAG: 4-alpha-glucanotransferase [Niabella sp.]